MLPLVEYWNTAFLSKHLHQYGNAPQQCTNPRHRQENHEGAKRIVTRFAEEVKDSYNIQRIANCSTKEALPGILADAQHKRLFCAPTWTSAESEEVVDIAKKAVPGVRSHVVLKGLVDRDGEDTMVKYLTSVIGGIWAGKFEG